ncbi:MAG: hypothetical protein JWM80_6382 [Cyanobacteria bacterium RYN_339]|nr:hypothetical protein [Cyanobacteria bacterium RYN_339]
MNYRLTATTPLATDPAADQLHVDEYNQTITFEYARFVNQNTTEYIRMADSKAAILITLLSANLLVLVQRTAESVSALHDKRAVAALILGCLYATASLAVAVNTIRPRLFRNAGAGHIFWEDIAARDKSAYAAGIQHLRVGDVYRELGEHNHNLARAALRKYRWLRAGFTMAMTSIVLSAILILFTT